MHKKLPFSSAHSFTRSLKQQQCYLPNKLQVVTMAAVLNGTFFQFNLHCTHTLMINYQIHWHYS